mgnify:CR=1 FL=1
MPGSIVPKPANALPQDSKVGKKLSDLTTRRVIILVLSMLISVPIFDSRTYVDDNTSYDVVLKIMSTVSPGSDGFNILFKSFVE